MATILTPEQTRLSVEEKLQLIGLSWDSLPEDQVPVPEWHRRIIGDRTAEFGKDAEEGQPWDELRAELERD